MYDYLPLVNNHCSSAVRREKRKGPNSFGYSGLREMSYVITNGSSKLARH